MNYESNAWDRRMRDPGSLQCHLTKSHIAVEKRIDVPSVVSIKIDACFKRTGA